MANPNKRKGTAYESDLVKYLNSFGLSTYRPAQAGARDTGDIHNLPLFAVQAKNWKSVADAVREGTIGVEKQRQNLGAPFGVNFVKRPRYPIGEGYAVMRIETFVAMLQHFMPWAFEQKEEI